MATLAVHQSSFATVRGAPILFRPRDLFLATYSEYPPTSCASVRLGAPLVRPVTLAATAVRVNKASAPRLNVVTMVVTTTAMAPLTAQTPTVPAVLTASSFQPRPSAPPAHTSRFGFDALPPMGVSDEPILRSCVGG